MLNNTAVTSGFISVGCTDMPRGIFIHRRSDCCFNARQIYQVKIFKTLRATRGIYSWERVPFLKIGICPILKGRGFSRRGQSPWPHRPLLAPQRKHAPEVYMFMRFVHAECFLNILLCRSSGSELKVNIQQLFPTVVTVMSALALVKKIKTFLTFHRRWGVVTSSYFPHIRTPASFPPKAVHNNPV